MSICFPFGQSNEEERNSKNRNKKESRLSLTMVSTLSAIFDNKLGNFYIQRHHGQLTGTLGKITADDFAVWGCPMPISLVL